MLQGPTLIPKNPKNACIILHGFGSSGEDLISLASMLRPVFPETAFFAPNGPQMTPMGMGYQWFSDNNWTFKDYDGMIKTHAKLEKYIQENIVDNLGISYTNVILFGFSQGTMMSLFSAPRFKHKIAGVLGFSGKMMWEEKLEEPFHKPNISLIHGLQDDVVPHEQSSRSEQALKELGFNVSLTKESGIAHHIGKQGLNIAIEFMKENFKD